MFLGSKLEKWESIVSILDSQNEVVILCTMGNLME